MNGTRDTGQAGTTGDNGGLDPRAAATLFQQATRQARRQLAPSPPWLLVIRAILVLVACGTIWFTVRGQHPYRGPIAADLFVVVPLLVVNFVATVAVARHATIGVRGRSRLRPAEIAVLAVIWIGAYVVMGVLAGAGVSHEIVYGWYPVTVPLILAGLAWAVMAVTRAQWRAAGTAVAIVVVAVVGVAAGPVGAWAVVGVGLCAALLGAATAVTWQQRA
jgi:hypothetical protein